MRGTRGNCSPNTRSQECRSLSLFQRHPWRCGEKGHVQAGPAGELSRATPCAPRNVDLALTAAAAPGWGLLSGHSPDTASPLSVSQAQTWPTQGPAAKAWEGPKPCQGAATTPCLHPQPALCCRGCQIWGRVTCSTHLLATALTRQTRRWRYQMLSQRGRGSSHSHLHPSPTPASGSDCPHLVSQEARATGHSCQQTGLRASLAPLSSEESLTSLPPSRASSGLSALSGTGRGRRQEGQEGAGGHSSQKTWLWASVEGHGRQAAEAGLGRGPQASPWTNSPSSAMSLSSTSLPCRRKFRMGPK